MSVRGPSGRVGVPSASCRIGTILEPVETFEDVARPTDRLAELTVADDVDPDLGLPAHDLLDAAREQLVELGVVTAQAHRWLAVPAAPPPDRPA